MAPPDSFLCAITAEIMADPVSTADGHTYEHEAIAEWLAGGKTTSPLTGEPLAHLHLTPNHALRQAIQQYIDEHPADAANLYRPKAKPATVPAPSAPPAAPPPAPPGRASSSSSSILEVSTAVSFGLVDIADADENAGVAAGLPAVPSGLPPTSPVVPVQPPPPPPLTGLTPEDVADAAAFAVADWAAHCAPKRAAASGGGWFSSRGSKPPPAAVEADAALGLRVRALGAVGGGIALEVQVATDAGLYRLAQRLAAPGTQPIAALRLTSQDGFGAGTANASLNASDSGAFALLTRALATCLGGAPSLAQLRELAISKIAMGDHAASHLATALAGHPALGALELWNVALEDAGALAIGRLAARDGSAALTQLNLGRNLYSGDAMQQLEALVDRDRVHAKIY